MTEYAQEIDLVKHFTELSELYKLKENEYQNWRDALNNIQDDIDKIQNMFIIKNCINCIYYNKSSTVNVDVCTSISVRKLPPFIDGHHCFYFYYVYHKDVEFPHQAPRLEAVVSYFLSKLHIDKCVYMKIKEQQVEKILL